MFPALHVMFRRRPEQRAPIDGSIALSYGAKGKEPPSPAPQVHAARTAQASPPGRSTCRANALGARVQKLSVISSATSSQSTSGRAPSRPRRTPTAARRTEAPSDAARRAQDLRAERQHRARAVGAPRARKPPADRPRRSGHRQRSACEPATGRRRTPSPRTPPAARGRSPAADGAHQRRHPPEHSSPHRKFGKATFRPSQGRKVTLLNPRGVTGRRASSIRDAFGERTAPAGRVCHAATSSSTRHVADRAASAFVPPLRSTCS
jgi:hypothetical protein